MGNLPPVEPPDLRNRRQQQQDFEDDGNYPPNPNYRSASRYTPPQPQQPQGGYPPQPGSQGYPPQDYGSGYDSANYDSQGLDSPQAPDLRRRVGSSRPNAAPDLGPSSTSRQGSRSSSARSSQNDLGGLDAPALGARRGSSSRSRYGDAGYGTPAREVRSPYSTGNFLAEHQIEALAYGVTILLLGVGIILLISGNSAFLTRFFPLIGGGTLLGGGVYQKIIKAWNVSIFTWFFAILLMAIGITNLAVSGMEDATILDGSIFFCGTLVIMAGGITLLQVFRRTA